MVHCSADHGIYFDCPLTSHLPHFLVASITLLCPLKILKCSEVRAYNVVCKFKLTVTIATYPDKMPVKKAHDQLFDVMNGADTSQLL